VFRADHTGNTSLEVVRLLNRTIKERRFNVHPKILTCLLHLRLKSELSVRSSESKADKGDSVKSYSKKRAAERRAKGKDTGQPHLTKKMKKALKEKKVIDREFREAEAEVDKEERATTVSGSFFFPPKQKNATNHQSVRRSRMAAYGDAQVDIRALLQDFKKSETHASTSSRPTGYLQICESSEH
jgi:hypothetical protein